jgi:hypothetical protein
LKDVTLEDRPSAADWFVPAIAAEGSVDQCLQVVQADLKLKADFVELLRFALRAEDGSAQDAVTSLQNSLAPLETTLRFRLEMLRPERPGAWFRAPVATVVGPFAASLLPAPVFGQFPLDNWKEVKTQIELAYQEGDPVKLPFQDSSPNLWRMLVEKRRSYLKITRLPRLEGTGKLNLDTLPDGLPEALDSRSMRAFLLNVRTEIWKVRDRIDACYQTLNRGCEKFWVGLANRPQTADEVRDSFRKRRESRLHTMRAPDRDALAYFGFTDYPDATALRKRYHELAKKLHPDRGSGDAEQFVRLQAAYERLQKRLP